jgi:hypothetical protein
MSRRAAVGLAMASLVLLTVACLGLGGSTQSLVGEEAPVFAVQYQTKTVTLNDLKGKVIVLIFWSST